MKQFAYIYRLTNSEGLKYIGSHLVISNKTIYTDKYCGSSQDPRINSSVVCKEILCTIHGYNRKELYRSIQEIEHNLILDLDAINNPKYANATTCGVMGLNYKRLGAIMSNKKQKELSKLDEEWKEKRRLNQSKAQKAVFNKSLDWHRKGQNASAKSRRDNWTEELYNNVVKISGTFPDKKAYAIWTKLGKPTKNYKSIFHILNYIKAGKTWEDIK